METRNAETGKGWNNWMTRGKRKELKGNARKWRSWRDVD